MNSNHKMRFIFHAFCFLLINTCLIYCDYIQSDEIILTEKIQSDSEIIDINSLLTKNHLNLDTSNNFKLVQDTPLINYIQIRDASVYLIRPLDFQHICKGVSFTHNTQCLQTLKIIAVNNNHFIEVPVRINKQILTSTTTTTTTIQPLKPLNFEHPSYSIEIFDDLKSDHVILKPKLKFSSTEDILFSFTESSDYFKIDQSNGQIELAIDAWNILATNSSLLLQETTLRISVKAIYKELINSPNNVYNHMLQALAKINIKVKHLPANITVQNQILNNKVSVRDSDASKIHLDLHEPIAAGTELLGLLVGSDLSGKLSRNRWLFDVNDFFEIEALNQTYLMVRSKMDTEDLSGYKIELHLEEENRVGGDVLATIVIQLRVNYDPVIFEKSEYEIVLTDSDVLNEDLVQIGVQPTFKNSSGQIRYDLNGHKGFQIDAKTGWIRVNERLDQSIYQLKVTAKNLNTQLAETVTVAVRVRCENQREKVKNLKFQIFENSPKYSTIGALKPVCRNLLMNYEMNQEFVVKVCQRKNCTEFRLNKVQLNLANYLEINQMSQMVTTALINGSLFTPFLNQLEITRLFLRIQVTGMTQLKTFTYQIDLQIKSAPKILNTFPQLLLSNDPSMPEGIYDQNCLYNYQYLLDMDSEMNVNALVRFVRIDKTSGAHLQAEFKTNLNSDTRFFIHNNGCLALKYTELDQEKLILKAQIYELEFKLCYYEDSRVACSQLYSQKIRVVDGIYAGSKLNVMGQSLGEMVELEEMNRVGNSSVNKLSGLRLVQSIGSNVWFILLVSLLAVTVVVLAGILVRYKVCLELGEFKKKRDEFGGHKDDSKISVTNSETSTGSSHLQSNTQSSETTSNTLTTSSKISKTDDENEDDLPNKIRVSDDYLIDTTTQLDHQNLSSKYVYTNTNFSYAGSFSSISSGSKSSNSSASCKTTSSDVLKNLQAHKRINENHISSNNNDDQGLYSVKNASIRYENNSKDQFNLDLYSTPSNIYFSKTVQYKTEPNNCLLKVTDTNENQRNYYKNETSLMNQIDNVGCVIGQGEMMTRKPSIYESYYISSNKDILLNPDDIIASIV